MNLVCNKSLPRFSKTFILQKWHFMMPNEPLTHFTTLFTARNHFSPTDLVYFILKIELSEKKKKTNMTELDLKNCTLCFSNVLPLPVPFHGFWSRMTPGGTLQTEPPFVFLIGEKETMSESCQTFKVATAQTSGLVNLVSSRQPCFFECKHLFIEEPMTRERCSKRMPITCRPGFETVS